MPIRSNETDAFPGAGLVAAPPVSEEDCCAAQGVQLVAALVGGAGHPYVIKGGRCFIDATAEEVATLCEGPEPAVSGVSPQPWFPASAGEVSGSGFGETEGEVWLTNNSSWASSTVKVEQTVDGWTATAIDITVVQDSLPIAPQYVYVFVFTHCGAVNAVGYPARIDVL